MVQGQSPSTVMYKHLKTMGISYGDAAMTLMKAELVFGGRTLASRIEEKSQLSRRIVHVEPDELPVELFADFSESCATFLPTLIAHASLGTTYDEGVRALADHLRGDAARDMTCSLQAYGQDTPLYANAVSYVDNLELHGEEERALLHLVLFVATGCLGNAQRAVDYASTFAHDALHAAYETLEPVLPDAAPPVEGEPLSLALARIREGRIDTGVPLRTLDPEGTEVGLLGTSGGTVCDVDADVSRRHARIWLEDGAWFVVGLGSTNGTVLERGSDGTLVTVEPPAAQRDGAWTAQAVRIAPTDILHFGATTSFMVLPAT